MIFTGNGKVWDAKKGATLCKFGRTGVLDTDDPYVIKRLHELGYEEADDNEMVSIELCNSVNVDWREKYELMEARYRKLKVAYVELEKKINDMKETMNIPAKKKEPEDAEQEIADEYYDVDGVFIPKDYTTMNIMKLKKILRELGFDNTAVRKYTKDETITAVTKLLHEKKLID